MAISVLDGVEDPMPRTTEFLFLKTGLSILVIRFRVQQETTGSDEARFRSGNVLKTCSTKIRYLAINKVRSGFGWAHPATTSI